MAVITKVVFTSHEWNDAGMEWKKEWNEKGMVIPFPCSLIQLFRMEWNEISEKKF